MKILSFQPDSLYKNGGCSRVLRRLYYGHEREILSMYVSLDGRKYSGDIAETRIDAWPVHKPWMRWKLRGFFSYLRESFFFARTSAKVLKAITGVQFDVLHVVNHGPYCAVVSESPAAAGKPLWVSFHDHFSLCSTFEQCKSLWERADRRLVISEELGMEYQKLFSDRAFELITDGVDAEEISEPKIPSSSDSIHVYFGGLLHIAYLPLLKCFADALDKIAEEGTEIKLVLRGTQRVDFLKDRRFITEYRDDFVTDEAIKRELDEADILYLPIKFSSPEFFRFSLSTKMIGYLGGAGAILFHGPFESAACKLLYHHDAAVICPSLDTDEMIAAIHAAGKYGMEKSINAKKLASDRFLLENFREQFWNGVTTLPD